jgi:hypothetical protein
MKNYALLLIFSILLFDCKQKPQSVQKVPEHLRTDQNWNFEKKRDTGEIDYEFRAGNMGTKNVLAKNLR